MANNSYPKSETMLCGSACLYYLGTKVFNVPCEDLPDDYIWITDIAAYVISHFDHKASLSCFDSRLYEDYKKANFKVRQCFEGFQKVDTFIKRVKPIEEIEIYEKSIDSLLAHNQMLILNVASVIFHQDATLNGGHYVVVIGQKEDEYLIVNPGKYHISEMWYPKELLIEAANCFGSWMITITKPKK